MILGQRRSLTKPLQNLVRFLTTESTLANPPSPVNQAHLLRVCTILYQQQNSPPESRLHSNLNSLSFNLTHEFFLQVCNNFPLSWRPVYLFYRYTQTNPSFTHTAVSLNKMLDVVGKSRNIELFWDLVNEMGRRRLVNDTTFVIGLRTLAKARELNKCVEFFHVMGGCGIECNVETLNKVIKSLCGLKLVEEAKFVVFKLKERIRPDGVTFKCLIKGFCDAGDLVEAGKIWNLMVDQGFDPCVGAVEKMMETLFKTKRDAEAMKLFQMMRLKRMEELGLSSYRLVIQWMCKKGKVENAHVVYDEMRKRGIKADNFTWGSLVYGLLARRRVNEAYGIVEGIEKPDISVYHGLMKGLLRLKRPGEATQVFREMIKRGCEPNMHTYVMLLQGHLGKRGRKGKDPLVNFDTIFVGGLLKAGKSLEATKYVERATKRGLEVPRFDYNKFLHYYSNEEGVAMFEEVGKKLREAGMVDLADIFQRYGEKMATRDRRRDRAVDPLVERS
ncbi:putative pentatricopeptide [Rosa chinensis]|uniref:Putative pentatricopeptide n=1 Tax=Rosa chinensis TaxID=74649 RepID=A0A2P6R2J8_ROSCH|nr:putative pentatricopeptide repeat-containing protein At1g26500 [Rosa chinensis]PRQ40667.1 putative pentatricopeptide [Rosa chinensis]